MKFSWKIQLYGQLGLVSWSHISPIQSWGAKSISSWTFEIFLNDEMWHLNRIINLRFWSLGRIDLYAMRLLCGYEWYLSLHYSKMLRDISSRIINQSPTYLVEVSYFLLRLLRLQKNSSTKLEASITSSSKRKVRRDRLLIWEFVS